jgi:prephenate dehydrogenase
MNEAQPRLAIIGPGLIGTSVALAAHRRWPNLEVRVVDRGDPLEGVGDSLVVVVAAPVQAVIEILPRLAPVVTPQTLVLDTGSTKLSIMLAAAAANIPQFVGGHPMAGGTTSGPAEARADLFDGRPWFLTNPDAPDAVRRATRFVEALGAHAVPLSDHGQEHDRLMAAVSHLPQVTASALMVAVARAVGDDNLKWAGKGLRDTTRLASSGAGIWESVLATNSRELKPLLKMLAADLSALADRLEDRDTVRRFFEEAARAKSLL